MATVSDITTTPLSGLNYIDALLDTGPDWNYLTDSSGKPVYTLTYTFSIASGNEDPASAQQNFTGTQQAFTSTQQQAVRAAFAYLTQVTGIQFAETTSGSDAQLHLSYVNLIGTNVTGLCSWHSNYYKYDNGQLVSYDADAYVYLDNDAIWGAQNANLSKGGDGYETLLHELGHALGLKHPFYEADYTGDNKTVLPDAQDNTSYTLMSYDAGGGPYDLYRDYDLAALHWLYGDDGLRGTQGMDSTGGGRYISGTSGVDTLTGTSADDKLAGNGGNNMIDGGAGNDTAVFGGVRTDYTFTKLANGDLQAVDKTGTTTLHSIELIQFGSNSAVSASTVLSADATPPGAPVMAVTHNANGYAQGSQPYVSGTAEANAIVKIYTANDVQVGTAQADAKGVWSTNLGAFADGMGYSVYATATDASGNTSTHSAAASFNIDAHAPVIPTLNLQYTSGDNVATFSGTGEAGTLIEVVRAGATADDYIDIATTTVRLDGTWSVTTSPLPNAGYSVNVVSSDKADNVTASLNNVTFTVANGAFQGGTANDDVIKVTASNGSHAIDGGAGRDTAILAGKASNYTIVKETWGFGVTDKVGNGGHDAFINVERLHFDDVNVALDIGGPDGQVYRLYKAAFDREPDVQMNYWIDRMDNGLQLEDMAKEFMTHQDEWDKMYGQNPTNEDFLTKLYAHVLHRGPDNEGYAFWLNALNDKIATREHLLAFFSESPENQLQVIGSIQNGFTYTPFTGV
jgi:serralysin